MASFGSMAPMPIPAMSNENPLLKQGMALMQQAQAAQRQPANAPPGGGAPQGLLQRLLNPAAPAGAPTDLAAPGMPPGGTPAPAGGGPLQMGLLAKLLPQLMGAAGGAPAQGAMPPVPASNMPPIY
jgi:hypothetical protein